MPGDHRVGQELILITASEAPGILQASDARVGQTLDGMMAASMPGLRRSGAPERADAGNGRVGARYDYEGRAPDGRAAKASTYVNVEDQKAAAISIVADPSTLSQRRAVVEGIFQSFHGGASADDAETNQAPGAAAKDLDPRLIGMFAGESIHSTGGVYVNTQLVYALGADGVILSGARSHMNASQGDGAGGYRWTATGQSDPNSQRGTWSARNGLLTIRWSTGSTATLAYGFEPDGTLALRNAATRELINIYNRVQ